MVRCRVFRDGALRDEDVDPTEVPGMRSSGRLWLDLVDPSRADLDALGAAFSLHPLAIEDAVHRNQRSKIEVYEGGCVLALHAVRVEGDDRLVDAEIHAIAGDRSLLTLRFSPAFDTTEVERKVDVHAELAAEGGGFLLYALLDVVVDGYLDVVEGFEERADAVQDLVFASEPAPGAQQRIFDLKHGTGRLRRLIAPLRDALLVLQDQPGLVTPALAPYYRDVQDHVLRVLEYLDNIRDLLSTALDVLITQMSNRLNQAMKSLTSWGAIILVPSLIAGIYGMNFSDIPELRWAFGYPMALGLMIGSAVVLYAVFKRRGWL